MTTTMERISEDMSKARTQLDELRLKTGLLKLEAREKKDEVLADLEKAYGKAAESVREAARATGDKAQTAREAARDAWKAFRARYAQAASDGGKSLDE